jgi:hypothetical protein
VLLGQLEGSNMVRGIAQADSRHWLLHRQLPPIIMVVRLGPFDQGTPLVLARGSGSQHTWHPACFDALCLAGIFCLATLVLTMESTHFEFGGCNFYGFIPDSPGSLIALGTSGFKLTVLSGFLRDWHVLRESGSHRLRFHFCFRIGALAALLFKTTAFAEYREPGSDKGSRGNPGDSFSRHWKTGM